MARYRRSMMPINRIKHVVDSSATLASGNSFNLALVKADDAPELANTNQVLTGSTVNGVYLRVEVSSNEKSPNAIANVYMAIVKNPGGNITIPLANTVGSSDNKRFVIHQEMLMLENEDGGNPRVLFNGVIAIPKGYRRFAPNDELIISILAPSVDITFCYQAHYKEFR